jgi:DNA-directed RNA polymerase beta' subunit
MIDNKYFLATHGARKGLADSALKTSDSWYLTNRMVAPRKKKGRYQWNHNFVIPKKKTIKILIKLLKQIGGKSKKYLRKHKFNKKWKVC